ncbi:MULTISPECIES: alpha/beta hydrolase [unclassified Bradyrhizobium]|uniref:alpha/beta hydrolase n=1 Tax=unclassified Bradyrhizobium TaxID=2631580 RepID=UPI001FFA5806|nr:MULTISPECIES: alpha/beta hydrolase [unclassified Bradyrhizobium]MCK1715943.1 alpha/beta hydrolase [Bradyrhizobium sp. 143]MCK1725741.1 alpha/beta hydrolase [Bradyrhizobium sp. 142]
MDEPGLAALLQQFASQPRAESTPLAKQRTRLEKFAELFPSGTATPIDQVELGGVSAERTRVGDGPVVLYLHGGGYAVGSPRSHRHLTERLALDIRGTVFSLQYRLAPEAPYPAALDDATAAYKALLSRYGQIAAVAGDSAGGGLSFALLMVLRDCGLPSPQCVVGLSPWVNLKSTSVTFQTLAARDLLVSSATADFFADLYAGTTRQDFPLVSPLQGNVAGLPPTHIQAGQNEVFLGDICAFAQKLAAAGVPLELQVWEGMFHVWQLYWPKLKAGRDALHSAASFIARHATLGDRN